MKTFEALVRKQRRYVVSCGGYENIKEADDIYNDLNREIIKAYKVEHGNAVLGSYLYYGDEAERIRDGKESPYTEYKDQSIANFSCDFILPKEDPYVTEIIRLWNSARIYRGMLHSELVERVEAAGGMMIVWY